MPDTDDDNDLTEAQKKLVFEETGMTAEQLLREAEEEAEAEEEWLAEEEELAEEPHPTQQEVDEQLHNIGVGMWERFTQLHLDEDSMLIVKSFATMEPVHGTEMDTAVLAWVDELLGESNSQD
jgi:hypothetical protein